MSNPVFNFLQELINLMSTKFSGKGDMPVSEDSKDAYKWLLEQMKRIQLKTMDYIIQKQ